MTGLTQTLKVPVLVYFEKKLGYATKNKSTTKD